MFCPDCKTKVLSFDEYCKKCGADLHLAKLKEQRQKNLAGMRAF